MRENEAKRFCFALTLWPSLGQGHWKWYKIVDVNGAYTHSRLYGLFFITLSRHSCWNIDFQVEHHFIYIFSQYRPVVTKRQIRQVVVTVTVNVLISCQILEYGSLAPPLTLLTSYPKWTFSRCIHLLLYTVSLCSYKSNAVNQISFHKSCPALPSTPATAVYTCVVHWQCNPSTTALPAVATAAVVAQAFIHLAQSTQAGATRAETTFL